MEDSRAIFKGHERQKLRAVMTSFPALRSTIFDFDELLNATLDIIEDQRLNGRDEEEVKQCLRRESLMLEQEIEQLRTLNDYLRTKLDCDLSPSFDDRQDNEGTYHFAPPPSSDDEDDDDDSDDPDFDEDSDSDDADIPEDEDDDEDEFSDDDEDEDPIVLPGWVDKDTSSDEEDEEDQPER